MSDNNTYFDDFLKSQVENQKIEGNKSSKAAFLKKAARYRFWHFFPLSFNVYYLVLILIVFIAGGVYFSTNLSNEPQKYQPESSHDVFDMELNLPDDDMGKNINTVDDKSDKPQKHKQPEHTLSVDTKNCDDNDDNDNQGSDKYDVLMDTVNNHETQDPDNNQDESEKTNQDINKNEQKDTAPVIDTVVREKRVQHTDTIKKEIKKTIEIKKDREKRRHR